MKLFLFLKKKKKDIHEAVYYFNFYDLREMKPVLIISMFTISRCA